MSSGAKVKLFFCEENTPGVTPVAPNWYTVRRITDGLTESVTTETSDSVKDTRFRSGGVVTESEITGDLQVELSVGVFDRLWSAVAMNDWATDVLNFGGDTRKTFTFVKVFTDTSQVFIYRGVRVNEATLSIGVTGKITSSFALMGTDFARSSTNPVTSPVDESEDSIVVSTQNVIELLVNDETVVGTACLQSLELTITNNMEAYRCIGNGKSSPQGYNEKMVDITLSSSFMFGNQAAEYIDFVKSRVTMPLEFKIADGKGNSYLFDFPKLEVSEAGHPDGGAEDTITLDVSFNHIDISPTITRVLI